jgi:hypothetical protein
VSIRKRLPIRFPIFVLGASAALLAAPAARSADPAWDRAKVTQIAEQLAKACDQLYVEYLKTPNEGQVGTGDALDSDELGMKLRRLQEQTRGLAGRLAGGKGQAETKDMVKDVGELADDIRVLLAETFTEQPLIERVDAARDVWRQLLPYYGMTPPPEKG